MKGKYQPLSVKEQMGAVQALAEANHNEPQFDGGKEIGDEALEKFIEKDCKELASSHPLIYMLMQPAYE